MQNPGSDEDGSGLGTRRERAEEPGAADKVPGSAQRAAPALLLALGELVIVR